MSNCPGCGQHVTPTIQLTPRPVPTEGEVLFVLALPSADRASDDDIEVTADTARALAEEAAPGRAHVVLLGDGVTLDMLTDVQLAAAGLRRSDPPSIAGASVSNAPGWSSGSAR